MTTLNMYQKFAKALNALGKARIGDCDVREALASDPDTVRLHNLPADFVTDNRVHMLVEARWVDLYMGRIPGWTAKHPYKDAWRK